MQNINLRNAVLALIKCGAIIDHGEHGTRLAHAVKIDLISLLMSAPTTEPVSEVTISRNYLDIFGFNGVQSWGQFGLSLALACNPERQDWPLSGHFDMLDRIESRLHATKERIVSLKSGGHPLKHDNVQSLSLVVRYVVRQQFALRDDALTIQCAVVLYALCCECEWPGDADYGLGWESEWFEVERQSAGTQSQLDVKCIEFNHRASCSDEEQIERDRLYAESVNYETNVTQTLQQINADYQLALSQQPDESFWSEVIEQREIIEQPKRPQPETKVSKNKPPQKVVDVDTRTLTTKGSSIKKADCTVQAKYVTDALEMFQAAYGQDTKRLHSANRFPSMSSFTNSACRLLDMARTQDIGVVVVAFQARVRSGYGADSQKFYAHMEPVLVELRKLLKCNVEASCHVSALRALRDGLVAAVGAIEMWHHNAGR